MAPAEKPRRPTRSGASPHSAARARTTRSAWTPSAMPKRPAASMSVGMGPPSTRSVMRYFSTNAATPRAWSQRATLAPSRSTVSATK